MPINLAIDIKVEPIESVNQCVGSDSEYLLDVTLPSVKSAAMPDARIIPVGYPICLQASDPARNIARRYTILVQRDFFGVITVDYSWGRIGSTGQCRRASFTDIDQAERFARKLLARRDSSRKRIGIPYRIC